LSIGRYARAEIVACLLVAGALAACGGSRAPRTTTSPAAPASSPSIASDASVGVRPGDAVRVRVYGDSALSGEYRVNENGRVVLPVVGRRQVAGLSPDSLRADLGAAYRQYYRDPVLDVTVLRRISILGAVRQPGLYPVDPTVSLAEALATAGGVTGEADRGGIRLIREGRVLREELNRETLLGQTPIRSGDRIFVSQKSWFARNWQWVGGTVSTALIVAFLR